MRELKSRENRFLLFQLIFLLLLIGLAEWAWSYGESSTYRIGVSDHECEMKYESPDLARQA